MKARNPNTGEFQRIKVRAYDNLPIGTEVDFEGDTIPIGWEEVETEDNAVVLYENTTGTTGNVTLNDDVDNYEYIEIFGQEIGGRDVYTKVSRNNTFVGQRFILSGQLVVSNNTNAFVRSAVYSISDNTTIKVADTDYSAQFSFATSGSITYNAGPAIRLYKVIGYKHLPNQIISKNYDTEETQITELLNGASINTGWNCKVTRTGNICHLELGVIPNTTSAVTIYTLPEQYRPSVQSPLPYGSLYRSGVGAGTLINIQANGNVNITVPSNETGTWTINATWCL